jgi:hypothetical protein
MEKIKLFIDYLTDIHTLIFKANAVIFLLMAIGYFLKVDPDRAFMALGFGFLFFALGF